jgi:hypothetical protein
MRKAVIVSPHFPPSAMVAGHRARHLAKHLPAYGWQPIVLRLDEHCSTDPVDPALAQLVSADLRQIRIPALPAGLMRRLGVGDVGLRTYPYLKRALDRLIAAERPDAILITGFPFYPMMLAPHLKRMGLPVVLDFQDPWVSAYGATRPRWTKEGIAHRFAVALEPKAVAAADFITSVSDRQNAEMAARYPWLDAARMAGIPIGGDPADYQALAGHGGVPFDPAFINIIYVGAFWPRAEPAVRALFRAMARLRAAHPNLVQRLRFHFIGTGQAPLVPLIEQEGVDDMVREIPARLPFLEALGAMSRADGILMFGSDEPHYTPSKIYSVLMAGRPYLSLFHQHSSANTVLDAAGGGLVFRFDSHAALVAQDQALADGLHTLATAPQKLGAIDPSAYAGYTAHAVAGRFAKIFDGLK